MSNSNLQAVDDYARNIFIEKEAEILGLRMTVEALEARNKELVRDLENSMDARADLDHERIDMTDAIDRQIEKRQALRLDYEKKLNDMHKEVRKWQKKYYKKKDQLEEANKEIKVCSVLFHNNFKETFFFPFDDIFLIVIKILFSKMFVSRLG